MDVFDYLMSMETLNINALNRYGQTCMHLAVVNDNEEVLKRLIKRGADVNLADESCCSPLHAAAARYVPRIVEVLLDNGADLNCQNLLGKTALYHACQYGTVDSVYMLLYYGAAASITDVYGVLPLTASMQQSMNCEDIPQSHLECHEVLFNYTFERKKTSVNLSTVAVAMKIGSPLFPQILRKINHVKYSRHDLMDLCRNAIYIKPEYFRMFTARFGYVVREMLLSPPDLHHRLTMGENVDVGVVKLMEFMTMLFAFRPTFNFVKGSSSFTYIVNFLVNLYKEKRLSMPILKQMVYFLFSHGLPCELVHIVMVYQTCGFCEILRFLLDLDVVVTFERPKAVMPYLIHDINLTIDTFMVMVGRPCKAYREALKFFATPKVRNWFGTTPGFRRKLDKLPSVPSLIELSREVCRKHIIDTFEIKRTRDFYRLLKRMPINEVYKKILTYERELYRFK